jgi:NADPH-dependent glutamate synthase beta subunit-like oxidoreductase
MRRGQSLVVWAIREARACPAKVDAYLAAEVKVRV